MPRSVMLALSVAVALAACGEADADQAETTLDESDPASTLAGYVAAYNAGDLDEVMTFFSEDSAVVGHPFAAHSTEGLIRIRSLHSSDLLAAADTDAYTITEVGVSGDTVTWDHVWVNSDGEAFCASGSEAVVANGKFLTWTWPDDIGDCP